MKLKKILVVVSTLEMQFGLGSTPAWWQLLKSLNEKGVDIRVVPFLGRGLDSPWWKSYNNPCYHESVLYKKFSDYMKKVKNNMNTDYRTKKGQSLVKKLTKTFTYPKWKKKIFNILDNERDVDAVAFFSIPLNQFRGIPSLIKKKYGIPVIFYDGDMPSVLPEYINTQPFVFNYYQGADLSEYDIFLVNSKGVIPKIKQKGANKVFEQYYGVDTALFHPIKSNKVWDVFFYGNAGETRKKSFDSMINGPAKVLNNVKFLIGGKNVLKSKFANIKDVGYLSLTKYKINSNKSKINLNITRRPHGDIYASSTSRVFELAAMGCAIVSDYYNGIEEWFKPDKEIVMVEPNQDISKVYKELLDSDEEREELGRKARKRVIKEHTYDIRAEEFIQKTCKI